MGIDSVCEEPGLQSVASATGTPASTSRRAGAYLCFMRKKLVPGSSTAVTPERARASTPAGETAIRWSAESAPSSAASSAPPESTNSSAWRRGSEAVADAGLEHPARLLGGEHPVLAEDVAEAGEPCLGGGRHDLLADQVEVAARGPGAVLGRHLVGGEQGRHQVHRVARRAPGGWRAAA